MFTRIQKYYRFSDQLLQNRLDELDKEWNTERILQNDKK